MEIKTKPILFNTEMVMAILDGKKSVTRRVLKPANRIKAKAEDYHQGYGLWVDPDDNNPDGTGHVKDYSVSPMWWTMPSYIKKYAPYHIGDILYVREKFCIGAIAYGEEPDGCNVPYISQCKDDNHYIPYEYCIRNNIGIEDTIWKPSLHMPKEAARIFLKVTDVRLERLQDIFKDAPGPDNQVVKEGLMYGCDFIAVWDQCISIKERKRYGYDANPWVWVIEFEVIDDKF